MATKIKRDIITFINKIFPNAIDDTYIRFNSEVYSKLEKIINLKEEYLKNENLKGEFKGIVLRELSNSLSQIDKFLFGFNFDHSHTKSLVSPFTIYQDLEYV